MERLLESLVALGEDEFTKEILKPLFEAMGYERVEFNGGAYERGRDLIAQRRIPPMKDMFVVYVQSKKIGTAQKTFDGAKFTTLVHQLRQCCTTSIKDHEGSDIKPNVVYLACPEQIKSRFLDEVMSQMIGLPINVYPYDGVKIINDIKEYKPELLEKLRPMEVRLSHDTSDLNSNRELLKALKSDNESGFKYYYSDLSFFVGSFDSNLLLHLNVSFLTKNINIRESSWKAVKDEVAFLKENFSMCVTFQSIENMEEEFLLRKKAYESESNRDARRKQDELYKEIDDINFSLQGKIKEQKEFLNFISGSKKAVLDEEEQSKRVAILSDLEDMCNSSSVVDIDLPREAKRKGDAFYKEVSLSIDLLERRNGCRASVDALKEILMPAPLYKVALDTDAILNKISAIKNNYLSSVEGINNHSIDFVGLKDFLNEIEFSLSLMSHLKSPDSFLSEAIEFKSNVSNNDRVSISPHDIFETRHDIAVYGGAGVGKTTTLKMYASRYAEREEGRVIYVPLNSLVEKYNYTIGSDEYTDLVLKNLLPSMILMSRGVNINNGNIDEVKELLSSNGTLILDGLDEVYNTIPNLLSEISNFKKELPGLQLIVSSRDCVSYLKEISFLGITLLPFTKPQLVRFVQGWFRGNEKSKELIASIDKKDLFENIRTPLLATITCSLVEKGVDAPSTENEIYSQRMRLLTGEYDMHKNIQRQKNTSDLLRKCARKIAFYMHKNGVRNISKSSMVSEVRSHLSDGFSHELLDSCVDELIDPCNVIIYEPHLDSYTFGHFRYQEHLAAEEINTNRDIEVVELLSNDWWRGVLSLYAQENDFCALVEDFYRKYGSIKKAKITFDVMIAHCPKSRKSRHIEIFNNFNRMDDYDERVLGNGYADEWDDSYDPFYC